MLEPKTKFIVDFAGDFAAGFGKVVVRGSRFVDKDEGGFVADADAVKELAFEAALFDEPTGVNLVAVFALVNWVAFLFGDGCGVAIEVNVVEERARAGYFERVR